MTVQYITNRLGSYTLEDAHTAKHDDDWCLLLNTQARSHVLIHHVADADRWDDLHEIGQDATVKSKEALFFHNLLHHQVHGLLL